MKTPFIYFLTKNLNPLVRSYYCTVVLLIVCFLFRHGDECASAFSYASGVETMFSEGAPSVGRRQFDASRQGKRRLKSSPEKKCKAGEKKSLLQYVYM